LTRLYLNVIYWSLAILRVAPLLPFSLMLKASRQNRPTARPFGFRCFDITSSKAETAAFFRGIADALTLIRDLDPVRFRTIEREVSMIANSDLAGLARYQRLGRVCLIDWGRIRQAANPDFSLKRLACTLIHDATHG